MKNMSSGGDEPLPRLNLDALEGLNSDEGDDSVPRAVPASDGSESSFEAGVNGSPKLSSPKSLDDEDIKRADIRRRTSELVRLQQARSKVSWGEMTMRHFPVIPGDHPDCSLGPPLMLGWKYESQVSVDIDEYEKRRMPRRHDEDLRRGWMNRRRILKRLGYTDSDLYEAQDASKLVRQQREKTMRGMKYERVSELKHSVLHKMGRTFHPQKALTTRY